MNAQTPDQPVAQTSPAAHPASEARQLLKELQTRFPVFADFSPLAIGIDRQVLAAWPEVSKKTLRLAMRSHTQSTRYLKATEKAATRFNLDGTPADEITDENRRHAGELLRERFKKQAEQKKNQAEAERAEQRRQEKLQQLTDRFGKKGNR